MLLEERPNRRTSFYLTNAFAPAVWLILDVWLAGLEWFIAQLSGLLRIYLLLAGFLFGFLAMAGFMGNVGCLAVWLHGHGYNPFS